MPTNSIEAAAAGAGAAVQVLGDLSVLVVHKAAAGAGAAVQVLGDLSVLVVHKALRARRDQKAIKGTEARAKKAINGTKGIRGTRGVALLLFWILMLPRLPPATVRRQRAPWM